MKETIKNNLDPLSKWGAWGPGKRIEGEGRGREGKQRKMSSSIKSIIKMKLKEETI